MTKLFGAEKSADIAKDRSLNSERQNILESYIAKSEFRDRPSFATFNDTYPAEEIQRDLAAVKDLRNKFAAEAGPATEVQGLFSKALEIAILEFGHEWLPGVTVTRASFYDDYIGGVDLFLEYEDAEQNVQRVGLDVTWNDRQIVSKLLHIYSLLKEGVIGKAKYFRSKLDTTKGRIAMPRMVIGADQNNMIAFFKIYSDYLQKKDTPAGATLRKQIKENWVGSELIIQLAIEIERSLDIVGGLPNSAEVKGIQHALETLNEYLPRGKKEASDQAHRMTGDRVSEAILSISSAVSPTKL